MCFYNFRKGANNTVVIQEHEFDHPPMDETELRNTIRMTRLQREKFASEGQYRNAILMYELALKFLLEEQA